MWCNHFWERFISVILLALSLNGERVHIYSNAGLDQVSRMKYHKAVPFDLQSSVLLNGNTPLRSASSSPSLKDKPSPWSKFILRSKSELASASLEPQLASDRSDVSAAPKVKHDSAPDALLLLDLDKCTIFGSDGNDLGIAMQWTNHSQADLTDLYRLLLNPCVPQTYHALKARHPNLRVAIYTERPALMQYRSPTADRPTAVPWNPAWLDGGQLYIPQSADAAAVMRESAAGLAAVPPEDRDSLRRAVERLLAARAALCAALGLAAQPDAVVTAAPKDVPLTARRLGCPAARAHLWDDNTQLRGRPGALVVPPFTRLAPAQRARLLAFLEERLPLASLPPELVEFMLEARPQARCLARSPAGELEYRLPAAGGPGEIGEAEPWPLPPPTAD